MTTKTWSLDDKLHWYKDAIIYELHIKAFHDSNGDGIGDFGGLMDRLDYLRDLGVNAIWLLPFYPSPLRDDGYDIADYYHINPAFGNISQFKKLLREAHRREIKVITELVINHTSDQHPWFQQARKAPKGSPARSFYVWTDDPDQYKDVRIIFQDFEASNWTWDEEAQQYYWHRFFHHQPDLNYDNPKVQDEVFKIIDYWCMIGVDGFRLDAVPYLFEREGTNGENLPETHAFLKKLRAHVDHHFPGTLLLAEANMWPEDSAAYFGAGDECHMNYHFPVMPRMFMALQMEDRYPITDIFDQTPDIPETCQWAIFLRNHDELTLEMVTDEERDYMYKVYSKDPKARINLGIRHRLAPLMENNRRKIELLNCLLFSLPGTPVIYYGDEIGMGDNYYLGDRDGVRTPMQWTPDRNAGFSKANPQKLYLPVILDPEYHYQSVNVEMQERNTHSLLWWMKRVINMRKKYKAFSRGNMNFINAENPKVLAFTRTYEDETMLVVVNLSRFSQPAELALDAFIGHQPVEAFSKNKFPPIKEEISYFFTLGPHAYHWFSLQKVHPETEEEQVLAALKLNKWSDILKPEHLEHLESQILPPYLMRVRWFGGKGRKIQGIKTILHSGLPLPKESAVFLLVEINYESGLPEIYQLQLTFGSGDNESYIQKNFPQAILARLTLEGHEVLLYDALYSSALQEALISRMAANQNLTLKRNGAIIFSGNRVLRAHVKIQEKFRSKVFPAEQSNTSIIYDNAFFLKIYRKVDRTVNPDLEITQFLTQKTKFRNIPALTGSIEWRFGKDSIVLGMMQVLVENSGDGWSYMLGSLNRINERILSRPDNGLLTSQVMGKSYDPVDYEALPDEIKELFGVSLAEQVRLLGKRTGEMHLALATPTDQKAFMPEVFSLHYQRSLYSGLQSLVRSTFQNLRKNLKKLPGDIVAEAETVLGLKDEILKEMQKIYEKKIDAVKIRIHGDFHLGQVLFTGRDFVILDFEGEPSKSYSERRLKRSPLRDVAGMIRSFHYVAYGSLFLNEQMRTEDQLRLLPYAEYWHRCMSGLFIQAYFETAAAGRFIPDNQHDLEILIKIFMLEKAIYELNYELNNRPDWVVVPLRSIISMMGAD
jgi:maltose alpha-D-glucosyltransferase / alpha-amylase